MPSGIINTNGKLAPWKHDATRDMTPPERVSTDKSIEEYNLRKKEKAKEKKKERQQLLIKEVGRSKIVTSIKHSSFQLTYSKYKGLTLKVVAKQDPVFIESFIKTGDYTISESVLIELKGIIESLKQKS